MGRDLPVITALREWRWQEGLNFKASTSYIPRLCLKTKQTNKETKTKCKSIAVDQPRTCGLQLKESSDRINWLPSLAKK